MKKGEGRRRIESPSRIAIGLSLLAVLFVAMPIIALMREVAWSRLLSDLTTPEARSALRLSLLCSLGATSLAALLGLPLAWVLARVEFRGRAIIRGLVLLPLVVPPVVAGVGLLAAFGRNGMFGGALDVLGLRITFTPIAVVLAEAFVALPFLVLAVEAGIRGLDRRNEEAARTLGASRGFVMRRITLPLLAPSLTAGLALAWARALGEFGATITFAGNIQGRTRTVPLAVYLLLDSSPDVAIALSLLLVLICVVVLVTLRARWIGAIR
ncbi:molybdate ABC transporter, permease protein [Actinobacteria bacterium IMCC26256]|nr:molybdate ABC transporter, permease protein [Actinobacteria bacterium IMCC26256]